ncbi:MAG: hypothetical protein IPK53_00670 [bacterium]|nr:hypothetical protein [bacterium]
MNARSLKLHLSDRAKRGQMMYHAVPGLYLILNGVSNLFGGHVEHLWVDLLGIAAGLALLFVLKRELKHKGHSHGKVAWFEVIAGVVVMIEGFHKLHRDEWFQPGTVQMLAGLLFVAVGLFHERLLAFRTLRCTDEGFAMRIRPIYRISGKWSDIKSFALDEDKLVVTRTDGSTTPSSLRSIENRADVLAMLNAELARSVKGV